METSATWSHNLPLDPLGSDQSLFPGASDVAVKCHRGYSASDVGFIYLTRLAADSYRAPARGVKRSAISYYL